MGVDNSDFEYMAHCRGNTQKDMFYVGAYLGYDISNKLRSLSGQNPTASISLTTSRTYAHNLGAPDGNGGSGYDVWGFYQLIFMQCMYTLKYKNLSSQTVIGNGVGGTGKINTGGTETKGMDWGTTADYKSHMKLFGIEDFYGNLWDWIDGFWCDSNKHIWTATENFNDSATGYVDRSTVAGSSWNGYPAKVYGDTHKGFVPISSGGSTTTYYCDYVYSATSCMMLFGWSYSDGGNTNLGVYSGCTVWGAGNTGGHVGARIMYV